MYKACKTCSCYPCSVPCNTAKKSGKITKLIVDKRKELQAEEGMLGNWKGKY